MGGSNDHPNPIDFKYRLRWYILGRHSSAAISINKNCEKDDDESLLTPLEEKEICLTESLFSSIIDTKCVLPSNEDSHLVKLQFVDTDTHHFSEVEVEVDVEDNKISTEGLRYVAGYIAQTRPPE